MASSYSGSAPQPTEKQLKLSLKNTKYLHPSAAAKQIIGSLDNFVDLKPSVKEYTLADGKKMDLMQLSGIISLKNMDKQYNIPVRVWLPRAFPKEKPYIYISPSPDLALSSVDYVDPQGCVYLPYLSDWKESRSDMSTLLKILKFKFGQHCPVYHVRLQNFSFDTTHSVSNHSSPISTRKLDSISQSSFSNFGYSQEQETAELRNEIESKDHELTSYKKTIKALSVELDELRSRVRDLEQEKHETQIFTSAREREDRAVSGACEEVIVELERSKTGEEKLKQLLQEETEKLAKEMKDKEKIKSRLDSKVSDLTQTREKIAILEVEKEDYQQRLHRALRDLKHSKTEVQQLVSIKRALKTKVSALEVELNNMQERSGGSSDMDDSSSLEESEVSALKEKVEISEKMLEEMVSKVGALESEKQQLSDQLDQSSEVEERLISEREILKSKPDTERFSQEQDQVSQGEEDCLITASNSVELAESSTLTDADHDETPEAKYTEKEVQIKLFSSHGDETVQAGTPVECVESEVQVNLSADCEDKEAQVDTVTEMCTQYKQLSEEKRAEVRRLKEELLGINIRHQRALKESESKIHQLLHIKERLSVENGDLNKQIDQLKATNLESTLSSALHSIQELERGLGNTQKESESEQLRKTLAKMEEMRKAHKIEIQAIIQKVAKANMKVKEEETKLTTEIKDLTMKLDQAQQQLQVASNTAALKGSDMEAARVPENNMISFMEVESDALYNLDGGTWGSFTEVVFRGKRVTARCISKESLAQYPIHIIRKQVNTMAYIHHPNLVLFIAIAMDAPSGLMVLTELMTCSLRQAYQSQLIKQNKLPALLDVALALNFLHLQKRPITHNNLSSSCVMVEEGGSDGEWRAKLSDIGSTTSLMILAENKEREVVYFAPELASSPDRNGTAVDLYSYGVLMSEVANNSLPSTSTALSESISSLKPTLPQISCLIQCCIATDPEHRPLMGNMVKKIKNLVVNKIRVP